jgi:hypothetical protein
MKITLLLCALASHVFGAQPVLVRVNAKTLADLQARDPMIRLVRAPEGEARIARPENPSIVKDSTILHDGTHWTLVPNGAVVHLPKAMKARVNAKPVGILLPWSEFLTKNPSWLGTEEVTFDQAAGTEALPAERAEAWKEQDKIVVAVHRNGPISVLVGPQDSSLTQR